MYDAVYLIWFLWTNFRCLLPSTCRTPIGLDHLATNRKLVDPLSYTLGLTPQKISILLLGLLNSSEKSAFTITTSAVGVANNATDSASLLLDGIYFEPLRNHKLQYFDRNNSVLYKWIQVRFPWPVSGRDVDDVRFISFGLYADWIRPTPSSGWDHLVYACSSLLQRRGLGGESWRQRHRINGATSSGMDLYSDR